MSHNTIHSFIARFFSQQPLIGIVVKILNFFIMYCGLWIWGIITGIVTAGSDYYSKRKQKESTHLNDPHHISLPFIIFYASNRKSTRLRKRCKTHSCSGNASIGMNAKSPSHISRSRRINFV